MNINHAASVYATLDVKEGTVYLTSKQHRGFPQGTNKPTEYSWFYILALQGKKGELIKITANQPDSSSRLTRDNSLVFYSTDQFHWRPLSVPVLTNHQGLVQQYQFKLPTYQPIFISNTIFYDYTPLYKHIHSLLDPSPLVTTHTIGQSINKRPLEIFTFARTPRPRGRILVTTGCHPAEPDVLGSLAIIKHLLSPAGDKLLRHYLVDIMPLQNPDGYATKNCLNARGINLYWNFRYQDKDNCPEAFYLWRYIKQRPPILYLDFHAYVHQYHRHPMPYLQSPSAYTGRYSKKIVRLMDQRLIQLSRGYYRLGSLSMWPDALSTLATAQLNTICYTKYHFNMFEGIDKSRQRAINVFTNLTNLLLDHKVTARQILKPPHGQVRPDNTDSSLWQTYYRAHSRFRQAIIYLKSYYRYYRHRNRVGLFNH